MAQMGETLHDYTCYRGEGMSVWAFFRFQLFEWLLTTVKSFIGFFGKMLFELPYKQYWIYYTLFFLGLLLFVSVLIRRRPCWRDGLLMGAMTASVAITVALHFWQSYARDYQPQGRYIISAALLVGYFIAYGMDKTRLSLTGSGERKTATLYPAAALAILWLLLFVWAWFGTMRQMLP